jgi:hypothetical protein
MNCNKEKKIADEIIRLIENLINQTESSKNEIENCQIKIEDVANIRKFFKIKILTENKVNSISEIKIIKILEKYYNSKNFFEFEISFEIQKIRILFQSIELKNQKWIQIEYFRNARNFLKFSEKIDEFKFIANTNNIINISFNNGYAQITEGILQKFSFRYKDKFFEYFDDSSEHLNCNGMTYQSLTKEIVEIKCDDPKVIYHVFKNLPFSFKPIRKALFRIKTEYELKQVEKLRKKLEERR